MKAIHVWGYLAELEAERLEIDKAIATVLGSGRLILGHHVESFEKRFASYCGARYGVGVGNGTDAIFLALKALDIGPGDEVITVANTAVPTVSAIVATGARPRFVDIDPETYLMDVEQVGELIDQRTKCVLPVHLFGQCVDMTSLATLTRDRGVPVVEDCAQAHGAEHKDRRAGSMLDLASFSFYPTKVLGGYGDGGMVVGSSTELDARLRRLRFYGMEKQYYSVEHGYNSRLDELHAAILLHKLSNLDDYLERRRRVAERYDRSLAGSSLDLPRTATDNRHAYYLYVVRHPRRDLILERLRALDIHLNVSYRWPIHTMTAFREFGYRQGDLPHTELAAEQIFSLPMFPYLSEADQDRVSEALLEILETI